jgi:hypothetical protein
MFFPSTSLLPKLPPVRQGMTFSRLVSTPIISANAGASMLVASALHHTVMLRVAGFQLATTPAVSIACADIRCQRSRRRMTTFARAKSPSTSPKVMLRLQARLESSVSCSSGAPPSSAANGSVTVGSSSYSTRMRSHASSAWARLSAATAATASPS